MPVKLIGIIILMVIIALLTGFNLDNRCDIWLFYTFKQVPVFGAMLASFVLGVFVTLPFTFGRRSKKNRRPENPQPPVPSKKNSAKGDINNPSDEVLENPVPVEK